MKRISFSPWPCSARPSRCRRKVVLPGIFGDNMVPSSRPKRSSGEGRARQEGHDPPLVEYARHYGQRRQRRPLACRRAHPGGRRSLHDRLERRRAADAPRRADRRGVALPDNRTWRCRYAASPTSPSEPLAEAIIRAKAATPIRLCTVKRSTARTPQEESAAQMAEAHPRSGRRNQRHGLLLRPLLAGGAGRPRGRHRHQLGRHPGRGVDGPRNDGRFKEFDLSFLDNPDQIDKPQYKPLRCFTTA